MSEGTVCADCRHVYVVNKNDGWWRWLCIQAPRPQSWNPVTGQVVADPPYGFCKVLNQGDCGMFEAAPKPKETES